MQTSRYLETALVIQLCGWLIACSDSASMTPPAPPPAAVTVVTLTEQPLMLTRELPGRVTAFRVAEVRPQVTGIVKELLVREGGMVEAGQPLYQLDDAIYRADEASARAALERAHATLDVAKLAADRSTQLVGKGSVSKQENDNAIARLREAEANVAVAAAALSTAKVKLAYARISAPISGRVGKSTVTQGALVTANQDESLLIIQQQDPIYVDLTQSATEMLELRRQLAAGTLSEVDDVPVKIRLDNNIEYPMAGRLVFSEAAVDPSTGSYMLRIEVPNPDNILLPGMYVRAVISTGQRENAVLVPQQGITRDPKGNAIAMVVDAEGKAELRMAGVNRTVNDQWLVDSGLVAGDRVIVEGLQRVRPGAPVQVTETRGSAEAATLPAPQATP